ncbi:hypothetical protein FOWG_18095 [Fusarium oxysporum f. sp. lycopersici MN25]|nr:hypothetical protein FOWG_18095 [Fusarium oxysporum f. sp. lycopersici MN25]
MTLKRTGPFSAEQRRMGRVTRNYNIWKVRVEWIIHPAQLGRIKKKEIPICLRRGEKKWGMTLRRTWPLPSEQRMMNRRTTNSMLWKAAVAWTLLPSKLIQKDKTGTSICMRWEVNLTRTWPFPEEAMRSRETPNLMIRNSSVTWTPLCEVQRRKTTQLVPILTPRKVLTVGKWGAQVSQNHH